ncbi:heat shock transcription factor, Y-linked-like [Coturnix japonica]|uniref:heat shock transcription factor, Y-linked-like n=1 Tax=Coturnix japonica TaxID=93934 RepID=UPI0013A5F1CA|nr:heat shock transcription factor, Y-linked-like [Coturnix japonica]
MAARATFVHCESGHTDTEASASDVPELAETSGSTSTDPAGQDQAPAGHAAGTSIVEEQDSQMFPDEEETKGLPLSCCEESSGQASVFSPLSFRQELWVLAECEQVKSLWRGHGGNCTVIDEELSVVEVLAKEAPVRAFGCTSMKSFVHQLNYYGFTKVPWDLERSPSLPEFLAEEEATASHRKVSVSMGPHAKQLSRLLSQLSPSAAPTHRVPEGLRPARAATLLLGCPQHCEGGMERPL